MVERIGQIITIIFGIIMVVLSVIVTVETLGRKFLGISLQGIDELGGYVLAVTSSLAFTLALIDRAHIRIDLFHRLFPTSLQRLLDWLSVAALACFATLLAWVGWLTLAETIDFRSTAPTPWATPLVWPQSLWLAGLVIFMAATLIAFLDATRLLLSRRWAAFGRRYGPKSAEEELHEELADLERR